MLTCRMTLALHSRRTGPGFGSGLHDQARGRKMHKPGSIKRPGFGSALPAFCSSGLPRAFRGGPEAFLFGRVRASCTSPRRRTGNPSAAFLPARHRATATLAAPRRSKIAASPKIPLLYFQCVAHRYASLTSQTALYFHTFAHSSSRNSPVLIIMQHALPVFFRPQPKPPGAGFTHKPAKRLVPVPPKRGRNDPALDRAKSSSAPDWNRRLESTQCAVDTIVIEHFEEP